jgi:uncharacterized membrane protein YeiH
MENLLYWIGLAVFFAVRGLRLPPRLFLIPDAVGLALFTIAGTQVALEWQAPWLVASLLGVITGVVGGVLRDVLCNNVPLESVDMHFAGCVVAKSVGC